MTICEANLERVRGLLCPHIRPMDLYLIAHDGDLHFSDLNFDVGHDLALSAQEVADRTYISDDRFFRRAKEFRAAFPPHPKYNGRWR